MIRITIKSKPTFKQASRLAGRFASQRRRLIFEEFDWASLAPAIAMAVTEVFDTEGQGRWPPLNPDYAAWKAEEFPGQTILRLTDAYFKAATQIGSADNIVKALRAGLFYGISGPEYAFKHEVGEGVPLRPVFGFAIRDESLHREMVKLIGAGVMTNIHREFRKVFNV